MLKQGQKGFTLIELMITIAVLTIIAAIAVPAYNEYVREARLGVARANIEPLRLALEDSWLDSGTGTYAGLAGTWDPSGDKSLENVLGWKPDGDQDMFVYSVALLNNGTSYTISAYHKDLPGKVIKFAKD